MKLTGNPVSKGIAIAPAYRYVPAPVQVNESHISESEKSAALEAVNAAFSTADAELKRIIASFPENEKEQAAIFLAHCEILRDEELYGSIQQRIQRDAFAPDSAVYFCANEFIEMLSQVKDETIQLRAADMKDVRNRLLRCLCGESGGDIAHLAEDCILISRDLLPSDTATLDRKHVLGIVTEAGGATSHTAILARSYGIPALVGVVNVMEQIHTGDLLVLDAGTGELIIQPTNVELKTAREKMVSWQLSQRECKNFQNKEAIAKDGTRIWIGQNIGSDADEILDAADFIGLFRTEFLYMHSDHIPTEDEQYRVYAKVMEHANGRMVTLRTLDIGGDKQLSYLDLPVEENPFLGMRGIRLCFQWEDIFRAQLRAALRASAHGKLGLLLPMVDGVEDIRRVRTILSSIQRDFDAQNIPYDHHYQLGVMIETPSAALIADDLAREVDFASIGSNDLCQYTHAVDRLNASVAGYYQGRSKAMLRLMKIAIDAFHKAGRPISICGELGGDPESTEALVGLGLRKLSMNASSIGEVKQKLFEITLIEAAAAAEQAMK